MNLSHLLRKQTKKGSQPTAKEVAAKQEIIILKLKEKLVAKEVKVPTAVAEEASKKLPY